MAGRHPTTEAGFRAESDARALAEAAEIKGDKGRMVKAQRAATRLARERQKEAAAMKQVSKAKRGPPRARPKAKGRKR